MTLRQREFLRACGYQGDWLDELSPEEQEKLLRQELYYEITPKDQEPSGPVVVEDPWQWRTTIAVRFRGDRYRTCMVHFLRRKPRDIDIFHISGFSYDIALGLGDAARLGVHRERD